MYIICEVIYLFVYLLQELYTKYIKTIILPCSSERYLVWSWMVLWHWSAQANSVDTDTERGVNQYMTVHSSTTDHQQPIQVIIAKNFTKL